MEMDQLHYTSCRRGLSGGTGFQTRAMSSGISPEERRQIEHRSVYQPPRDLEISRGDDPAAISAARARCPPSLRAFVLDSGRLAVLLSSYVGLDYSGRWGNYFCHALVLEELMDRWPIDFFGWSGWQHLLAPEEDTDEVPPPLPPLSESEFEWSDNYSFSRLQEFLHQPSRREHFASMLRAVFAYPETSRALVVRDRSEEALCWIACVQKAFPPSYQAGLSSSSYQADPRSCLRINATTGESDFLFDDAERRFQFYVFDFETGEHSEVVATNGDFADVVAGWLADAPEKLQQFHHFLSDFTCSEPGVELEDLLCLYRLDQREISATAFDDQAVDRILESVGSTARVGAHGRLVQPLLRAVGGLTAGHRPERYRHLIHFLRQHAMVSGLEQDRAQVWKVWLQVYDDQICGGAGDLADRLQTELRADFPIDQRLLAELFLKADHLVALQPELVKLGPANFGRLLRDCLHAFEVLGRSPVEDQPELAMVLEPLLENPMDRRSLLGPTLAALLERRSALVWLLQRCAQSLDSRSSDPGQAEIHKSRLGEELAAQIAFMAPTDRARLLAPLDEQTTWSVLLGEWETRLRQAGDSLAAYHSYRNAELASLPDYERSCGGKVAGRVLERLDDRTQVRQVWTWLRDDRIFASFPDDFKTELLARVARSLSLIPHKDVEPRRQLLDIVERDGLESAPWLVLQQTIEVIEEGGALSPVQRDDLSRALAELDSDAEDYRQFLNHCLGPLLDPVKRRDMHGKMLAALLPPSDLETLKNPYEKYLLKGAPRRQFRSSDDAALLYWLSVDSGQRTAMPKGLATLETTALAALARRLGRLDETSRKKVIERLRRKVPEAARNRWQRWHKSVKPQGFFGRLLRR